MVGTRYLAAGSPKRRADSDHPWIAGNPKFPAEWKNRLAERLDAIVLTHGHFDHVDDLLSVAQPTAAPIACIFDMEPWLTKQGIPQDRCIGFNLGGTVEAAGVRFTMTPAFHSSSHTDAAGVPFTGLAERVAATLSAATLDALGSVGWYTTAVKLDLEARGIIERVPGAQPQRLRRCTG